MVLVSQFALGRIAAAVGAGEGAGIARMRPASAVIVTRVNCMIESVRGWTKSEDM